MCYLPRHELSTGAEGASSSRKSPHIHAEGYAAGELARAHSLIDEQMPVIVIARSTALRKRFQLAGGSARRGKIILITDPKGAHEVHEAALRTLTLPASRRP
jgi:glucosamine--fructose-6-phosphate aminotransferase (isomerizing)